ncbi:FAD:protein FMN transferase [Ileibacterium valens]|uniref:FAD:protein FMN transferase n=1 Tax=Ileibacterium valens TaxID=1862668 RepID=UPI0023568F4F|nr:FAD:protein FMN transferase [Ileibacterium valens]
MKTNDSEQKNEVKKGSSKPKDANMNQPKKKSSTGLWIFGSIAFLFLIFGISMYASSRSNDQADLQTRSVTLTDAGFDTPITFQAETTEDDYMRYLNIVKDVFVNDNKLFDQYHSYEGINNVRTLNEQAADHPVKVDPRLIDVIELSEQAEKINPKFDIAEGNILSLWHDIRDMEEPELPAPEQIDQAKKHTGSEGIIINKENNEISFADDSIKLDLGAVAKGYTAQKAKEALEEAGLTNGFINAGGNVALIGNKTDGSDWVVGIQKPDTNDSLVRLRFETPQSMVTSGDYQRFVTIDGKRYSHIIDPDTGYPAEFMRSVTVIDPDSAWADAMSTALFTMSVEDGMKVADENDLQAVWITDKGSLDLKPDLSTSEFDIYYTDGLADQISLVKEK